MICQYGPLQKNVRCSLSVALPTCISEVEGLSFWCSQTYLFLCQVCSDLPKSFHTTHKNPLQNSAANRSMTVLYRQKKTVLSTTVYFNCFVSPGFSVDCSCSEHFSYLYDFDDFHSILLGREVRVW